MMNQHRKTTYRLLAALLALTLFVPALPVWAADALPQAADESTETEAPADGTETDETAAEPAQGDLDRDGMVSAADARLALRFAVQLETPGLADILAGDLDGDGAVSASDARVILRAAVGLEKLGDLPGAFELETDPANTEQTDAEDSGEGQGVHLDENADKYEQLAAILPTEIPPAPVIEAAHDTFTFVTYGYGHCVGLTQYGAILMAQAGLSYRDIVTYYFAGTELVKDETYPEVSYYAGEYIDTRELVTRIVAMEIGGATTEPEALKSQAIAVYSLLKWSDYYVRVKYTVGYAIKSYSLCSENLRGAVDAVMGEYLIMKGDPDKTPCMTVYGAAAAGRTISAEEAWGYGDFPSSVKTPFEASLDVFTQTLTLTSAEMRRYILAWDGSTVLSEDPADWIEILEHDASLDATRGYVTRLRVGDKELKGIGAFIDKIKYLRSPCFTVIYTP